ncbi:helix-turn-helix domain-containing protein [Aneurinibacillus thermoaerophilus]|uniref:helix-turn-helix domain-containing protein n=1 Tax=Aneurinibacillus thermoaerophilus TaxID=143495 RepID=UPI002E1BED52|nr:helix-turn-helix domain-containing protein [Aneurinibacillus thermoaerophilus]
MNIQFMEGLFLLAASKFQGERTPQAIVHLLKGRKNNQVIADAALFGVSMLYGALHAFSVEEVRRMLDDLIARGWLGVRPGKKAGVFCLPAGEAALMKREARFRYEACCRSVSSVHEKVRAARFWKKLSLLIQTFSYWIAGEALFYPVVEQRELQYEVKRVIKTYPDKLEAARRMKEEMVRWMEGLAEEERMLLLRRLSGKARAGLTYRQLASMLDTAEGAVEMHVLRLAAEQLRRLSSGAYPMLAKVAGSRSDDAALTQTARWTKALLAAGFSLEEIVRQRGLKPGTIEDHIVEIAIADPAFDIHPFVSPEKVERIHAIVREKGTKKVGTIKREAGDSYNYLEIRLALVRASQRGR